jgi:CTP synthase
MKECGVEVNTLKIDPYLNLDAGTMNPNQHGEVFVTEDGYEADLDLGHYERFLGKNMRRENNMTAGQVFKTIIDKEREGDFLGATVQMVPHVTDEIKTRIKSVPGELIMIEIGGTDGDIEGEIFLEAVRELWVEEGPESFLFYSCNICSLPQSDQRIQDQAYSTVCPASQKNWHSTSDDRCQVRKAY